MSVVTEPYARSLARAECIEIGEWSDATATGQPALRCKTCGGIYEVDLATHRIEPDGFVAPAMKCDSCPAFGYVRLTDYAESVLR